MFKNNLRLIKYELNQISTFGDQISIYPYNDERS